MKLQDLIRALLPKDDRFYNLFEQQAAALHDAARVICEFGGAGVDAEVMLGRIREIEHRGDKLVRELETALASTFVTPIDREDIHLLSQRLDDALDFTYSAARTFVHYGVEKWTPPMGQLAQVLVDISDRVQRMMPHLRTHAYADILAGKPDISQLEKQADAIFRGAMSTLFRDESIDVRELLRDREVLEALELAVDRCEDAADILSHLAIKNA